MTHLRAPHARTILANLGALTAAMTLVGSFIPAQAEQRALLVGIGQYAEPGIDLPGIDLDLERMRETLVRLGFQPQQIRTLQDADATSTNVINAFQTWLRDGVKPDDRVVFYFSGHGSNVPDLNGDEGDHVDEVLVTHDMHRTRVQGKATLKGVVVDDQIGQMIDAIPSRHIWIIVDACHSGTITRSFSLENKSVSAEPVFVKGFTYPGMPEARGSGLTRDLARATPAGREPRYVSLTAAADNEKAIGTMKGGMFTIALTEAIADAASHGRTVSVDDLRTQTAAYIAAKVDKAEVHHPQVGGSQVLARSVLEIAPAAEDGPNRKRLLDLVAGQTHRLEVKSTKSSYAIDEPVSLSITVPAAGYLNVVTVDAKDNTTVLFPNHYQESNAVTAGTLTIPTPQMTFDLLASEPTGKTLVVAFVGPDPINFYQETIDDRDRNGNITTDFARLSHSATRAIRVAPRRVDSAAGQLELQIVPAAKP